MTTTISLRFCMDKDIPYFPKVSIKSPPLLIENEPMSYVFSTYIRKKHDNGIWYVSESKWRISGGEPNKQFSYLQEFYRRCYEQDKLGIVALNLITEATGTPIPMYIIDDLQIDEVVRLKLLNEYHTEYKNNSELKQISDYLKSKNIRIQ